MDGFCLQTITSKLEEKGSKTIIPRALQNGLLCYNCLRVFDHYAKPSGSTSLFYMTTCSKSRDYFNNFLFFFYFWEKLTRRFREM